jgi:hypothetical protein
MPGQVMLNQRIVGCSTAEQVFREVAEARAEGMPLNSVNLATALHRVARCGNANVFARLLDEPNYLYLLDEVTLRLKSDLKSDKGQSGDLKPREIANTVCPSARI